MLNTMPKNKPDEGGEQHGDHTGGDQDFFSLESSNRTLNRKHGHNAGRKKAHDVHHRHVGDKENQTSNSFFFVIVFFKERLLCRSIPSVLALRKRFRHNNNSSRITRIHPIIFRHQQVRRRIHDMIFKLFSPFKNGGTATENPLYPLCGSPFQLTARSIHQGLENS